MEGAKPSVLDRVEKTMKWIAAACLMGMALVTGADVLGRGTFNTPIFGSEEIVSILAVIVAGFSLPYAHSQKSHIGVDVLYSKLGGTARRWVKLCTNLVSAALFAVVSWRMVLYGMSLSRVGEVTMNLELPIHYVLYALAFGFAVFSLQLLRDTLSFFKKEGR